MGIYRFQLIGLKWLEGSGMFWLGNIAQILYSISNGVWGFPVGPMVKICRKPFPGLCQPMLWCSSNSANPEKI